MWFTENGGNRIGRLSVDGELSEYFLRDHSIPTGITVGPDGALWFAQLASARSADHGGRRDHGVAHDQHAGGAPRDHDRLRRRDLVHLDLGKRDRPDHGRRCDGAAARPSHTPQWITTGPDGALWFTARATNTIGRLTVGGGLTEYAVPTAASGLNGITAGPDGALWFTEGTADAVGRIEPGGAVSEIPLGEGAAPTGSRPAPTARSGSAHPGRTGSVAWTRSSRSTTRRRRRSRSHRRPTARC